MNGNSVRSAPGNPALASIVKLKRQLEDLPAVTIEVAAELLGISVRTLYRKRAHFEHKRQSGHLYFTLRGLKEHIEIEQYNPTSAFDVTFSPGFDAPDGVSADPKTRRTKTKGRRPSGVPFGSNSGGPDGNR